MGVPSLLNKLRGNVPTLGVYISGHGYGHCVRTATMLERLVARREVALEVVTDVPRSLWPATLDAFTTWRAQAVDVGVVQADDLTVDAEATSFALDEWAVNYPGRVDEEASRLRDRVDLVLGDVPPLAFDAAAEAGVPAVALANFSWDWIYEQMGFADAHRVASDAYAQADLLLELTPSTPMPAFRAKSAVGLLGRKVSVRRDDIRQTIGAGSVDRLVLIAFRAGLLEPARALPATDGVTYLLPDADPLRDDVLPWPTGMAFEMLVKAADTVVAKPGYGIVGDTAANGAPLVYVHRAGFPEDEYLEGWLADRPATTNVDAQTFLSGAWESELLYCLSEPRPESADAPGAEASAEILLGMVGN